MPIFHILDVSSIFLVCIVFEYTSKGACIYAFELGWFPSFYPPSAVHGDRAFKNEICGTSLEQLGIDLRPVTTRGHQKNSIEPKHGSISSIFLPLNI